MGKNTFKCQISKGVSATLFVSESALHPGGSILELRPPLSSTPLVCLSVKQTKRLIKLLQSNITKGKTNG